MNPENPPSDGIDDNADDQIVCPHCLHLNEAQAAFCAKCGAPIGMVANVDPMQQIYSEGFGFRSAADGPPSRIVLIGVWIFFVPMVVTSFIGTVEIGSGAYGILSPVSLLISVGILYRVTRNYLVKSREARKP